jgi:rhomboid protease GluP
MAEPDHPGTGVETMTTDEELVEFSPIKKLDAHLKVLTPRIWVTPTLVLVNLVVFTIMVASGVGFLSPSGLELLVWGADYGPKTTSGEWYRLWSSNYLHAGIIHIAFNMWILVDAGRRIERMVGSFGFFVMYTVSGILGSVASIAVNPAVISVGASGAVFGVFGCLLAVIARQRNTLELSALKPIARNAAVFIGFNVLFGLQMEGIDLAAHIGGLVAGFLCGLILAIPLEESATKKRTPRALALIAAGTAFTMGSAFLLPRDMADFWGEFQRFVDVEEEVVAIESEMVNSGELSDEEYARMITEQILSRWRQATKQLENVDLSQASTEQQDIHSRLITYAHLRAEAWQLTADGVTENDYGKLSAARIKQAEALAHIEQKDFVPPPTILEAMEAACQGGDAGSCESAGMMLATGNGSSPDAAKARILYDKACNGGSTTGCASLGLMFANGEGGTKDPTKARSLYEKACLNGSSMACNNLGQMWEAGNGATKDLTKARQFYEKACDGDELVGCSNLGMCWRYGRGGPKDLAKARALYEKACAGSYAPSCLFLALMYDDGQGGPQDQTKATTLYQQACEGGESSACDFVDLRLKGR